jgi:hypothetical protein
MTISVRKWCESAMWPETSISGEEQLPLPYVGNVGPINEPLSILILLPNLFSDPE